MALNEINQMGYPGWQRISCRTFSLSLMKVECWEGVMLNGKDSIGKTETIDPLTETIKKIT